MSEYFPEPKSSGGRMKVESHLSIYATKSDLKNAAGFDISKFAEKVVLASLKSNIDELDIDKLKNVPTNLSNLKSKIDKLDVDKLVPVSIDLSKLSDVVKNDITKKDVYAKIKNNDNKTLDITNLITKTTLNAKVNEDKGVIPSISNLATTAALVAKINEVKDKIPNITNLATTTAPTAVENKLPNQKIIPSQTN